MDRKSVVAGAPETLSFEVDGTRSVLRRADDRVALHGTGPAPDERAVAVDDGWVLPVPIAGAGPDGARVGPVFRRVPGGEEVYPTGLVFLRLRDGDPVEAHRDALRAAGWDIARTLRHAPHAAWLRPLDDDVAGSLRRFPELADVVDVAHVEPQLVGARRTR